MEVYVIVFVSRYKRDKDDFEFSQAKISLNNSKRSPLIRNLALHLSKITLQFYNCYAVFASLKLLK